MLWQMVKSRCYHSYSFRHERKSNNSNRNAQQREHGPVAQMACTPPVICWFYSKCLIARTTNPDPGKLPDWWLEQTGKQPQDIWKTPRHGFLPIWGCLTLRDESRLNLCNPSPQSNKYQDQHGWCHCCQMSVLYVTSNHPLSPTRLVHARYT